MAALAASKPDRPEFICLEISKRGQGKTIKKISPDNAIAGYQASYFVKAAFTTQLMDGLIHGREALLIGGDKKADKKTKAGRP